ncbi:MAG: hypothetical protein IJ491_03620 [Clostridia bacterium]|nr:hypothetical protein [Clostridia bacterium]
MLQNETPQEWKKKCLICPTKAKKDKYNSETLTVLDPICEVELCIQPVTDEAVIKEYGLSHTGSIQTVVYDENCEIKPLYVLRCYDEDYSVKGIKRFLSYRLVIAERVS